MSPRRSPALPDGERAARHPRNLGRLRPGQPDTYRRYELSDVDGLEPERGADRHLGHRRPAPRRRSASAAPTQTVQGTADLRAALPARARRQRLRGPQRALLQRHRPAGRHPAPTQVSGHRPRPRRGHPGGLLLRRPGLHDPCPATGGRPGDLRRPRPRPGEQVSIVASFPPGAHSPTWPPTCARARPATRVTPGAVSTMAPGTARAVSLLSYGGGITLPVLAAGLMGLLVWKPRPRRAVRRADAGPHPGSTSAPAEVVARAEARGRGAVRPARGRAARHGRHDPRRGGQPHRRHRDGRRPRRPRLPADRGGVLGGLFSAATGGSTRPAPQRGGEPLAQYEQTILDGALRDGQPGAAVAS